MRSFFFLAVFVLLQANLTLLSAKPKTKFPVSGEVNYPAAGHIDFHEGNL